jgi:hypothetical protein
MATLEVPNRYLAAAPIIVTSPTSRCGTTLVQRLLSSADNALIYGEEIGLQMQVLTGWFTGQLRFLERTGQAMDIEFEQALARTLADWRPGLMPPSPIMLKAWIETYYQMPVTLMHHAQSISRPIWGFKRPTFSRDTIKGFLALLPQAKIIYVFRNPLDVVKSAKARKFINTQKELVAFCAEWAKNMSEVAELAQDNRVLFLKYESMLEQRDEHVQLLELFTGAENIDAGVFGLKLNTYKGSYDEGYAPDQYIPPARLTKSERAAVLSETGSVMGRLYGDLLDAA